MMCCLWKGTLLFIEWRTTNCNHAIASGIVSAVHGLLKYGIMNRIIISVNFFLVLTRIGSSVEFLYHFSKE